MIMKMMKIISHDKENKGYLHKTGGRRNPNKMWNCIFCESTRIWGQTTLVLGLLKLEFHSDSTKNTSLVITFVS